MWAKLGYGPSLYRPGAKDGCIFQGLFVEKKKKKGSRICDRGPMWPTKTKILTMWFFLETVC